MVRAFFSSGGSEAVEAAFKLVRQYWRLRSEATNTKIISLKRGYHCITLGTLSANGITLNREYVELLLPGFIQVDTPHLYRRGDDGPERKQALLALPFTANPGEARAFEIVAHGVAVGCGEGGLSHLLGNRGDEPP